MSKNTSNSTSQSAEGLDYNGPDFKIHEHVVGDSLDDFASKLQGKINILLIYTVITVINHIL